jgi:CRP-like cAMP-binding protein
VVGLSSGQRIEARALRELAHEDEAVSRALFTYIGQAFHIAARSGACNAYHSIEQRLARWLLSAHDRAGADEFAMTHELLSYMVGASRPRVTEAAAELRKAGMIDYRTGRVRVTDRTALEQRACECYRATEINRGPA